MKYIASLVILTLIFFLGSCLRSYDNYLTKITVISDGENKDIKLATKEPTSILYADFISAPKGDTVTITIDWTESPWADMNPRLDDFYFWEITKVDMGYGYSGPDLYDGASISEKFSMVPGMVYLFDMESGEVKSTGERLEKKKPVSNSNNGGSSSGGGVNCDPANYNGPEFNIQVDGQCKLAYLYDCEGNIQGRDAACSIYYDYGESVWTGSGSLPKCPYCP